MICYIHIPNIKTLCLVVSGKKIFFMFSLYKLCKTCDPGAGPFLTIWAFFEQTQ